MRRFSYACLWLLFAALPAVAQDKIVFATDWLAQAEHGGFYQALAEGLYKKHGLDVTIRMGGPQVNNPQLLAGGAVDFNVGSSSFAALNYVKAGVPVSTVAAIFQKDPQVLLAAWRSVRGVVDGHYLNVPQGIRANVAVAFARDVLAG